MTSHVPPPPHEAQLFEDGEHLKVWLEDSGWIPFVDFEFLTATLSDGVLELDPKGRFRSLLPALESFARAYGYEILPPDPDSGLIALQRSAVERN